MGKHLYDLYYTNFNDVINNKYGGKFEIYAKSLGGIFGVYYGKKIEGSTVADFQRATEYVLGWMYMYGWNYKAGCDECEHLPWGGRGKPYSKDAFYYYGGWEKQLHNRPKRLRNLKVEDEICFGIEGNWEPGNIDTWGNINHVASIGEVYDNRIVIYDGAYMIENDQNYKVTIMLPKEESLEAERNALRKVYGSRGNNWGARRWFDLEDN